MKRALINAKLCRNCNPCPVMEECSRKAVFREESRELPWVDFYQCSGCLKCKPICPAGAIEVLVQPCSGGPKMGW